MFLFDFFYKSKFILLYRSDKLLNGHKNVIKFDNIQEIKLQLPKGKKENKQHMKCENYNLFRNGNKMICYKNTTIKKVESLANDSKILIRPVPVLKNVMCIEDNDDNNKYSDNVSNHSSLMTKH